METLILSCSTGGGHNAAGYAVKEELERRGHSVTMLDPYSLVGKQVDKKVGNTYIRMAQKTPRFFGFVYRLGNGYRRLPVHSPVYCVNQAMCDTMERFLNEHHFDVIIMPHVFPGEILTYMKNKGIAIPKTIFIATDYTCIPFTEEIQCDYYITPSPLLNDEFIRRGIAAEKLVSAGIPVKQEFGMDISCEEAKKRLGLDEAKHYLLLSGGSIGAGKIKNAICILEQYLAKHPDYHLIVICGNNEQLLCDLQKKYEGSRNITLLASTEQMALYLKACDAFLSKPGGLSSTEAAVAGIFLIHITPIPGCENKNMEFFGTHGMSIALGNDFGRLTPTLEQMQNPVYREQMKECQKKYVPRSAAADICDLAESIVE